MGALASCFLFFFSVVVAVLAALEVVAVVQRREGAGLDAADELWRSLVSFSGLDGVIVRRRMVELNVGVISW